MATAPVKAKPAVKTVGGLIFWPVKKPERFYASVRSWVEAGLPDEAWVYDSADTLSSCRIKIVDATYYRGIFNRIPRLLKPKEKKLIFPSILLVPITPALAKDRAKGIKGANTKEHHRLNYGA
jgi:hypothetical protein